MAAHKPRAFWGDLGLWREGIVAVEADEMAEPQVHAGADRADALVVPVGGGSLAVEVRCLGAPHPSSKDQKGWRATYAAMRAALRTRALRTDPLVWVADDTTLRTIDAVSPNLRTSAAHGLANGDVVLIRRAGAGLYSLGVVTVVDTDEFNVAAVTGAPALHAIAAADQVYLVEQYWLPMAYRSLGPAQPRGDGDWYASELVYSFRGSGRYTYSRTAASTVGS